MNEERGRELLEVEDMLGGTLLLLLFKLVSSGFTSSELDVVL